ncbi:aminopeptidase [Marinoscillum furvescens]|uniref:Putative aminopeptidase n=1 Tax=Marinoscillum furvescens DSM 4134 TaxID=1122208 RepID=A0A3D9KZU8_MARFU|nr:aminopeptidase [Marinoscillum furvescens]RED92805.1 putative aminopeptidase [Marinoscillum furvescens DSM 4134]
MIKKVLGAILLIIVAFSLWNWELLSYGYDQAKGQLKVIWEARPVEEFLQDPNYPDSLKQKLNLALKVRQFAIDSLGLHNSDNYTKLYDQGGQTLLWNVSASQPYELTAYYWKYPILGKMPYKGFFDLEKAKKEARALKEKGLDVRIRTVSGWSTLGILEDPLLSNMLERSDGALAEVIIHELTHATIFVKGEIEYNENLASFIGEQGAREFLKAHYGDSSAQHLEYLRAEADSKKLTQVILAGAQKLDSLYATFKDSLPIARKDTLKNRALRQIKARLDTTTFFNLKYNRLFDNTLPNNAYFMAFRRYHDQEDSIRGIYEQYHQNLKLMLKDLKRMHGK